MLSGEQFLTDSQFQRLTLFQMCDESFLAADTVCLRIGRIIEESAQHGKPDLIPVFIRPFLADGAQRFRYILCFQINDTERFSCQRPADLPVQPDNFIIGYIPEEQQIRNDILKQRAFKYHIITVPARKPAQDHRLKCFLSQSAVIDLILLKIFIKALIRRLDFRIADDLPVIL